ncbi:MAG: hypothetical protein AB1505_24985 [Candidatus Latescibacterota bacterium]
MRSAFPFVFGLGLAWVAAADSPTAGVLPSAWPAPPEILQYYRDLNFAACFSTPQERDRLRFVGILEDAEDLPQRLRVVGTLLPGLQDAVYQMDPGMVAGSGRRGVVVIPEDPLLPQRMVPEPAPDPVRPELTEVIGVEGNGGAVEVRVRVWPLSHEANARLVSAYERALGDAAIGSPESLLARAPRTQIHTWTRLDGRWMRNQVSVVPLGP